MRSPRLASLVAGALALLALGSLAGPASAEPGGVFGRSGRFGASFTCSTSQCHGAGSGGSTVAFTLTPLNADLPSFALGYVPGATYAVNVTVSGGPNVRNGFNWDSDAGSSRVLNGNTKRNTQVGRQAEMAHTLAGHFFSAWSFEWTAPADRRTVRFWLAGNSANGTGTRLFDAPTPLVTAQAEPVPVEILARIGNVNDTPGDPVPVLLVNGSRGDDSRVVTVATGGPSMEISIASYPGAPGAIPYALYALRRANRAGDETTIPNVGLTAFSFPVTGGTPAIVANTFGHEPQLGTPRVANTPLGPGAILTLPQIPAKVAGASITLQALVPDGTAASGGAVTNAIVVTFL